MKKNNIFHKTKRNIAITSTAIVFLCLLIFAIITQLVYSSRVFSNVDRQLIQQKKSLQRAVPHNKHINDFTFDDRRGGMPIVLI